MLLQRPRLHLIISGVLLISTVYFALWIMRIILPVVVIEIKYQYQKVLRDTLRVNDIRGLIMPQFRYDWRGQTSKNTTNGITIPALFIDEPVIYNVDPNNAKAYQEALKRGIAHASGTGLPGSKTLGYYFAHSANPEFVKQYNAVFYLLGKLKPNDEVYIWREGKRVDYRVTHSKITDPTDVSFLNENTSAERIVLQTCWPPGTDKKRLLIFADRIPTQ